MARSIAGIHHVTAIAGDPQRNIDFYTGVLGLRLVKRTVNFDDPSGYHLYFGDGKGTPGTILTFFAWPGVFRGRYGTGQAVAVCFSIPGRSVGYWRERFAARGLSVSGPELRFGEEVLGIVDPDGMRLELSAHADAERIAPWDGGPIPGEHAIRGFRAVTLAESAPERTGEFLTGELAFRPAGASGNRYRYATGPGGAGGIVDLIFLPELPHGRVAAGSVHHVAWRAASGEEQAAWRSILTSQGIDVTPVIDRLYFRSVYFREPGGVLFEIATDGPGFHVDESPERLGSGLMLPPWLEQGRLRIEKNLPPLRMPGYREATPRRAS